MAEYVYIFYNLELPLFVTKVIERIKIDTSVRKDWENIPTITITKKT